VFNGVPGINVPPPVPAPPPPPKLDPRNPRDGAEALARLKNNGPDVDEAFRWLRDADLNHPLRRDFARQLDGMVDNQRRQPFPNGTFFDAYFRWANAQDNFDSLMRLMQEDGLGNNRRQRAMETLARLKEVRAAEAIVLRLADFFDRGAATKALETLGPAAQPALLKHLNDANGDVRGNVQRLLTNLRVSTDVLITQTLADLKSTDDKIRAAALEWLTRTPVDERRRAEVARALNQWITPQSLEGNLYKSLELWGTAENGMAVANTIDNGNGFQAADRIKLLGKLKDPRTLPTLAARIGKFGFEGGAAKDALKNFGKAAEMEVVKQLQSPDQGQRHAACELLGEIGTVKVSIPAMQRAVNIYQQDRRMNDLALNAAKMILARGG
jgi:HEAT repeat protein